MKNKKSKRNTILGIQIKTAVLVAMAVLLLIGIFTSKEVKDWLDKISQAKVINIKEFQITDWPTEPIASLGESKYIDPWSGETITAATDELLITSSKGRSWEEISVLGIEYGFQVIERIDPKNPVFRVRFNSGTDFETLWYDLSDDRRIEIAEPNYIYYLTSIPDDPFYNEKYEFPLINAPEAWDIATGSEDIWVAVIDTGADRDHPDLFSNVVEGKAFVYCNKDTWGKEYCNEFNKGGETPGDGIDNNYNGWTDENLGHGTHVSGIIAEMAWNDKGACGIAHDSKILPLRVFPPDADGGASSSAIIKAINFVRDYKPKARIISMSLGSPYKSSTFDSAIQKAWDAGKIIVAAAGNSGLDTVFYPAGYDNVISVASLKSDNTKAPYSNYGTWIDISAYGNGIYSTFFDNDYKHAGGTSMACPLVSGSIALLLSHNLCLNNEEAVQIILENVKDVYGYNSPDLAGKLGSGIINPYLALGAIGPTTKECEIIFLSENVELEGIFENTVKAFKFSTDLQQNFLIDFPDIVLSEFYVLTEPGFLYDPNTGQYIMHPPGTVFGVHGNEFLLSKFKEIKIKSSVNTAPKKINVGFLENYKMLIGQKWQILDLIQFNYVFKQNTTAPYILPCEPLKSFWVCEDDCMEKSNTLNILVRDEGLNDEISPNKIIYVNNDGKNTLSKYQLFRFAGCCNITNKINPEPFSF